MTAIHQFVPTLAPRDAVGHHYLAVQQALRDAGFRSDIYAFEIKPEMKRRARPYKSYRGPRRSEPTWLLYHSSVGSPVGDFVAQRPEPLLVDYHNITPPSYFLKWEPFVVGQLTNGRRQLATLAPRARLGLADSTYNASELSDLGCPRTAVVPIMLDLAALERAPDPATYAALMRERERGGADWLFVGRLAPNKAQHDVIKAFAVYREHHDPLARLHLVGGSSSHRYATALEKFAAALGLSDAVRFPGAVSDDALTAYYTCTDILVALSEHEGFLVPLVEAMYHGLPIVAFGAAAVPETLGDAGIQLETKDAATVAIAVERVLTDAALRARLTERGRARVAGFDIAASRAKLLDAVRPVVEAG